MKRDAPHGADVYDIGGRCVAGVDFSSTVPSLPPPRGWRGRIVGILGALERYPQPYARGLDLTLEAALGLERGSVLPAAGASGALEWCARLAHGSKVRLIAPCFSGYRAKLERAGARFEELWWTGQSEPRPAEWLRGLEPGDQLWVANPGNPLGCIVADETLSELALLCRDARIVLVVDEALLAQRLDASAGALALDAFRNNPFAAVIRSLGKGIGLPGLRLGYLAAAPDLCARLAPFRDPWELSSLAVELGGWAFEAEAASRERRRRELKRRSENLRAALKGLGTPHPQGTGYFCLELGSAVAGTVAAHLGARGMWIRDCSTYGNWGRTFVRLNPRRSQENRRLSLELAGILGGE